MLDGSGMYLTKMPMVPKVTMAAVILIFAFIVSGCSFNFLLVFLYGKATLESFRSLLPHHHM